MIWEEREREKGRSCRFGYIPCSLYTIHAREHTHTHKHTLTYAPQQHGDIRFVCHEKEKEFRERVEL